MPVPTLYTCSVCDFSGTSMGGWGRFEYLSEESVRYSIPRNSALCYDCEKVSPAEIFPDPKEWKRLDEKARSVDKKDDHFFLTWYIEMKVLQKLMRFRTAPPRCLVCGGHNFDLIPPGLPGLVHRGCGGVIQADRNSAPWFYYRDGERLPKHLYSLDGLEIKDSREE